MLPALAQDRRTIDQDGRLHAPRSRISKANVCPYYGREIPEYQALGLDAHRVYHMYRTPELLQAAAASFDNVPLMVDHVAVSADSFPESRVGGTVSKAAYEHPYLLADVTAWTRDAIDGIESEERKELSCAYRYVASMINGTSPDGVRYDGLMMPPAPGVGAANHVALVAEGRAGPDVVVADGVPRTMTTKTRFPKFVGALMATLSTLVKPEQLAAMDSAIKEELAAAEDAFPDLTAEDKAAAEDAAMKMFGRDSLNDEEKRAAYQQAAKDKTAKAPPDVKPPGASDAATVQLAVDAAVQAATKDLITPDAARQMAADAALSASADVHALYAARHAVEPTAGIVALDSAEAVYRFALDKLTVPHQDVPAAALAALYAGVKGAPLAADAALAVKSSFRASDLYSPLN